MPTSRPLLSDLRTSVRDNLDEAVAAYWTDARLNRCLTRAADVVLQEIRKVRDDYFTLSRAATDTSPVTIYGESYDLTQLKLDTTGSFYLPPDCLELREVEVITAGYENTSIDLSEPISSTLTRSSRGWSNVPAVPTTGGFLLTMLGNAQGSSTAGAQVVYTPTSSTTLNLRLFYVSSIVILTTANAPIRAFTTDTDQLVLPHPLYMAVEEVASWRAQFQDHDPMAGAWDSAARGSVARFIGASARQSQDTVVVQGLFE